MMAESLASMMGALLVDLMVVMLVDRLDEM